LKTLQAKKVEEKDAWGLTVEVMGERFYFRNGTLWCDQKMKEMMEYTSIEH
jgi:hypothetical protein